MSDVSAQKRGVFLNRYLGWLALVADTSAFLITHFDAAYAARIFLRPVELSKTGTELQR